MRTFALPGRRHTDALQFSPDGRLLAVQGFGRVDVLDTATGATRPVCPGSSSKVGTAGVGFTADGGGVVYFDNEDQSVHAFDLATGEDRVLRRSQKVPWGSSGDMSVSAVQPNGRLAFVAVYPDQRTVEIAALDTASGKRKFSFARSRSYLRELAVSPDGGWVAGCTAKELRVWEVGGGKRPSRASWRLQDREHHCFGHLALSRDGAYLAAGSGAGYGRARLWDVKDGAELDLDSPHGGNAGMAFAADRPLLAFTRYHHSRDTSDVVFWDAQARAEVKRYDWGIGEIGAVAFSPDGFRCAAASRTQVVVWDVDM